MVKTHKTMGQCWGNVLRRCPSIVPSSCTRRGITRSSLTDQSMIDPIHTSTIETAANEPLRRARRFSLIFQIFNRKKSSPRIIACAKNTARITECEWRLWESKDNALMAGFGNRGYLVKGGPTELTSSFSQPPIKPSTHQKACKHATLRHSTITFIKRKFPKSHRDQKWKF